MKKYGKSRCKVCRFVEESRDFEGHGNKFKINYSFDCDSEGVVYLISCTKCRKNYVGSIITSPKLLVSSNIIINLKHTRQLLKDMFRH